MRPFGSRRYRRSLRRTIFVSLVLASVGSSVVAAIGFWVVGEHAFRRIMEAGETAGLREMRNRLALYDAMLSGAEVRAREACAAALRGMAAEFPTEADLPRATPEYLAVKAAAFGVSDLYVIDGDGFVVASSLPEELGHDLYAIGPRFASFLRSIRGSGRTEDHRTVVGSLSGKVNFYSYYGPKGSPFVLEASIRIADLIPRAYPGMDYESLARLALGLGRDGEAGQDEEVLAAAQPVTILALLGDSGKAAWSLVREGVEWNEHPDLLEAVREGKRARKVVGSKEYALAEVGPPASEAFPSPEGRPRRYAYLSVDRGNVIRFRLTSISIFLAACAAASAGSLFVAGFWFEKRVADRVESLAAVISKAAAEGIDAEGFADDVEEIASIAQSVAGLVDDQRTRAEALEKALGQKDVLLREVHHRVKNNMQMVLSLMNLQLDSTEDPASRAALSATRTRVFALSLAMDRLHASADDAEALDLDDYLRDLMGYLATTYARLNTRVEAETDGGGLSVPAERALPLVLAASELASNSYLHAFDGREAGFVSVRVREVAGHLALEVRDDGSGGEGAPEGVGLTIARALADQLGCSLEIDCSRGRLARLVPNPKDRGAGASGRRG